jgi:transcriptional regulator with XRE-family HTH domain
VHIENQIETERVNTQVSVGQAIRISRSARNIGQEDLSAVGYTRSMIGKIERGERKLAKDMAPRLAEKVRHPALAFACAVEFSGGYGSCWLDGPNVDSHRSAVKEQAEIEIGEAMQTLHGFCSSKPPESLTEGERKRLHGLLMELLDARQWIDFCAAVYCEDYGFDFLGINIEHHKRLKSMRLVGE